MNLFDELIENNKQIPLAELMRPKKLEDYLGQTSVINENSPIMTLLKSGRLFSVILWGPPGCGKTTLARLIAEHTQSAFIELSAVSSGVKDIKDVVEKAKENLKCNQKTVLFLDEIHRYSKTQQDALLPYLENGTFFLIGSTTENPSFQVTPALLSRVQTIRLNKIDLNNMKNIINKGFDYLKQTFGDIQYADDTVDFISSIANGDARIALNTVENSYFSANLKDNKRFLDIKIVEQLVQTNTTKYSKQEHYDIASAFQKSLRGSDKNAAIYYLAKFIAAGEDPRFIARRMIVCAAEDVGIADPKAMEIAVIAYKAVELIGMPEGRIPLALACIYIADAPKSNKSYLAVDKALNDIKNGHDYQPPLHIRDAHYKDANKYGYGIGYVYTHDKPEHEQQFLPDEIKDRKYFD